jgi:thiamine-monophosphate kinase
MNEFEFIRKIQKKSSSIRTSPSTIRVGIGDDCAVLSKDSKTDLVITTDLLVEDIDFRLDWTTPEFLGHKALAISLSDVAAMGAIPVWSMLSIGIPRKIWKTKWVEKFYDGYFHLAKKFNVELIGGDVSKTPDKVVIDSIVAGEVKKGKAILRSGAKAGDLIFVTGGLGGAAAGLKLLESGIYYNESAKCWQKNLLLKQLRPIPRINALQNLKQANQATSMIDLSDGLSGDLAHICQKSQVGAKIFADRIPFHKNLGEIAKSTSEKLNLALNGGEDFELLFTLSHKKKFRLENEPRNKDFFCIGEITANTEIIELIIEGKTEILQPKGFRHF